MTKWFILTLILIGACGGTPSVQGSPTVELNEFSITADGVFEAGHNEITVHNEGNFSHTVVIADKNGTVIDVTGLIAAGESSVFSVDLDPGTYELSCRIVVQTDDGKLIDHYHEGMKTTIQAGDT